MSNEPVTTDFQQQGLDYNRMTDRTVVQYDWQVGRIKR